MERAIIGQCLIGKLDMAYDDMPRFLDGGTFLWMEKGYAYSGSPPIDLLSPDALTAPNPWIVVAAVLENAKNGDHSEIPRLKSLVAHPEASAFLVHACLALIGDAGRQEDLQDLAAMMGDKRLRTEACRAAWGAGDLWLAPHMLEAWKNAASGDDRDSIAFYMSLLLDEHWIGDIACGSEFEPAAYVELVEDTIERLWSSLGSEEVAVWWGKPFGVRWIAERMRDLLLPDAEDYSNVKGMFPPLRRRFESATGIDCCTFYRKEKFQPLSAAALVDGFLESSDADGYEDGVRYFFGHRIPG